MDSIYITRAVVDCGETVSLVIGEYTNDEDINTDIQS